MTAPMYLQDAYERFNAVYSEDNWCSFLFFSRNFSNGKTYFCPEWDDAVLETVVRKGTVFSQEFKRITGILLDESMYDSIPLQKVGDDYTSDPLSRLVDAFRIAWNDTDVVRSLRYTKGTRRLLRPVTYDEVLHELLNCLDMHLDVSSPPPPTHIPIIDTARAFLSEVDFSQGHAFRYSDNLLQCVYDSGFFFINEAGTEASCLYFYNDQ